MNKSLFSYILLLSAVSLLLFFTSDKLFAQVASSDYKNNPEWIKMIGDPNANYYEAIKAYDTYWKYHEKPAGEEEELEMNALHVTSEKMTDKEKKEMESLKMEHEKELQRETNKKLSEKELRELEQKREMTYQCKRFEQWLREVKPFVQNDGRILSPQEQMDIYNKQKEEAK